MRSFSLYFVPGIALTIKELPVQEKLLEEDMSEPKEQLVSRAKGRRRAGQGCNRACRGRRGSGRSPGRPRGQAGAPSLTLVSAGRKCWRLHQPECGVSCLPNTESIKCQ
ncbi:hypothetical protein J1605_004304 [Eschrichtius robustus]|uniref:Uncharacterized protein n=1 Tax=Eschrichtius robustus TaxID=9764 RepID=A0AB34HES0_ESCRO|nr:hypothetical protein J1605_004304 [Eschrichtius robustus]